MMIRADIFKPLGKNAYGNGFDFIDINERQNLFEHRRNWDATTFFIHAFALLGGGKVNPVAVNFNRGKLGTPQAREKNERIVRTRKRQTPRLLSMPFGSSRAV